MLKSGNLLDKIADTIIILIMVIFCFITIYPFLYCLAYSLSDSIMILIKKVTIFPVGFTLNNYRVVFRDGRIFNAFLVSVARTVAGSIFTIIVTGIAAYAITKRDMPGNRILALILIIPMYISGGMIPEYVNIYRLGLFNTFLVYILPQGFSAYYMLIMRTYFNSLPPSIEESARLDGAGDIRIFAQIVVPLSAPIIATIGLFAGVAQWNSWYDALVYVSNRRLHPLQLILQQILQQHAVSSMREAAELANVVRETSPESIQMATLIISTVPIVCVYPFLQKYFVKGILIGGVKA